MDQARKPLHSQPGKTLALNSPTLLGTGIHSTTRKPAYLLVYAHEQFTFEEVILKVMTLGGGHILHTASDSEATCVLMDALFASRISLARQNKHKTRINKQTVCQHSQPVGGCR
jgi:hypothetical protein